MNTLLKEHEATEYKVCLLGASFDTGNLGVSALAESSIKVILNRWPEAEVTLLDSGRVVGERRLRIGDRNLCIKKMPIRFCKNIFLSNHFLVLCLYALLFKVFRWEGFKRFCARRNASLNCITQMDLVADITGGDSFSDIYGMRRFTLGFLRKWLVLLFKKDLIMLPQTYGSFKKKISKKMAAYILKKAKAVYSRDKKGIDCIRKLLEGFNADKVKLCPDIAFVLDAEPWDDKAIERITDAKAKGRQIVGLNISGLLYNGGYTQDNMFGLALDYPKLVKQIVDYFLTINDVTVVLVPHVFPEDELSVESDSTACKAVYNSLNKEQQKNVILPVTEPTQRQVKYLIGKCNFFMGARMHSCIAALSQCIPTVGMAYSDKFAGVFKTVDAEQFVVDMRHAKVEQILTTVSKAFEQRKMTARHLKTVVPGVQKQILDLFKDIS